MCLRFMENVEIGLLGPATLSLSIVEFIILVKIVELDIDLKRLATIHLVIVDQYLMLRKEVDLCIIQDNLTLITQLSVVDCLVSQFLLVQLTIMFMKIIGYDKVVVDIRGVILVAVMLIDNIWAAVSDPHTRYRVTDRH